MGAARSACLKQGISRENPISKAQHEGCNARCQSTAETKAKPAFPCLIRRNLFTQSPVRLRPTSSPLQIPSQKVCIRAQFNRASLEETLLFFLLWHMGSNVAFLGQLLLPGQWQRKSACIVSPVAQRALYYARSGWVRCRRLVLRRPVNELAAVDHGKTNRSLLLSNGATSLKDFHPPPQKKSTVS